MNTEQTSETIFTYRNESVFVLSMDVSKDFDTVNKDLLLAKLKA